MQPLTDPESTSITGFTTAGRASMHKTTATKTASCLQPSDPQQIPQGKARQHIEALPLSIPIKGKKKGVEEQWINLTIVGKRTNMVGERTNLRNQL